MARPTQDLGDGPSCPGIGADHKLITIKPSGRLWCADTQAIYAPATFSEDVRGFVAGVKLRDGDREHGSEGSLAVNVTAEALHGAA